MAVDFDSHPLVERLTDGLLGNRAVRQRVVDRLKDDPEVKQKLKKMSETERESVLAQLATSAAQGQHVSPVSPQAPGGGTAGELTDAARMAVMARIRQATLTEREDPLGIVTLTGYIGPAASDDAVRLYLDPTLRSYLSVRKADVIFRERFTTEAAPSDQIDVIWLHEHAPVARGLRRPRSEDPEARFLEGDLMDAEDAATTLPALIEGSVSNEPFCVSYTCCGKTSMTVGKPKPKRN